MIRKIIAIILVLFWMGFIFSMSNASGTESGHLSREVIIRVTEFFTDIKRDTASMEEVISRYSFLVRKCAHFVEYFILGLLVMNMFYLWHIKRYTLIYAVIICCLYALSDEVHQLFVASRSGQVSDVLLDSSAAILASYLYHYWFYIRGKYEKNHLKFNS